MTARFGPLARSRRRRFNVLPRRDQLTIGAILAVPVLLDLLLIWGPAAVSAVLSFTNWRGVGPLMAENWVGLKNYETLLNGYPLFWSALWHNLVWLLFFVLVATPLGVLLAVLLDRRLRGARVYQGIFYLPVVLSLAVVGFIWELQYAPGEGFIDASLGLTGQSNTVDWLGNPDINLFAVLIAATWRHAGYVMILYLAGLRSVDPDLREAAALDGASERQAFFRVVLPVLRPINVIVVTITAIEALRAFDIAYVINQGTNGLELLSTLVTNNSLGEANLVGFGSAIAVVLLVGSLVPIVAYLARALREERA
ncbi:MAG: multiple sugar transport system permease protein [Chloroflexota bacterium]|nr:multiple sugar transport system permease protein [Chloroflexota bacterium]